MVNPWKTLQPTLSILVALLVPAAAHAGKIKIRRPFVAGNTIQVTGVNGTAVFVYIQPKSQAAKNTTCHNGIASFSDRYRFTLSGLAGETLRIGKPLGAGDQVCVASQDPNSPKLSFASQKPDIVAPAPEGKLSAANASVARPVSPPPPQALPTPSTPKAPAAAAEVTKQPTPSTPQQPEPAGAANGTNAPDGAASTSAPADTSTQPQIAISGDVKPGATSISVTGTKGDIVSVYLSPFDPEPNADPTKVADCSRVGVAGLGTPLDLSVSGVTVKSVTLDSDKQDISFASTVKLKAGDDLCLYASHSEGSGPASPLTFGFKQVGEAPTGPTVSFADTLVTGTDTVWVSGTQGDIVQVWSFPAGYRSANAAAPSSVACGATDLPSSSGALALKTAAGVAKTYYTTLSDATQAIRLSDPLESGTELCIYEQSPDGGTTAYSYLSTVTDPQTQTAIDFAGLLVGGKSGFDIAGTSGATVSVYQFDANYLPANPKNCQADIKHGQRLAIAQSGTGSSSGASSSSITLTGDQPYTVTLASPLVAKTQLCLEQVAASGSEASTQSAAKGASTANAKGGKATPASSPAPGASTPASGDSAGTTTPAPTYSEFATVTDPNDYGRVRTNMTAGTMISNQQSNGNSSTAAEYLDFGVYYSWWRAGGTPIKVSDGKPKKPYHTLWPGLDSFFNVMLSPVLVSSQSTTTTVPTAGSSSTTNTATTVLNVTSSQQSARFNFGSATTWRLTRFLNSSNAFLLGPVAKGGFATLLNPTINSSNGSANSTSSSSSTVSATVNTFSSTYSFDAAGLRLTWAEFSNDTNESPNPFIQFDVTMGRYSSLPSYICNPAKSYGAVMTMAPTTTTCFTTTPPPSSTATMTAGMYYLDPSRTLIPRIRAEGFAKFPNYPFVLGLDANLAQYSIGQHHNAVDPLSKPGSDVRIFIGISVDPMTLLKKLNVPAQ